MQENMKITKVVALMNNAGNVPMYIFPLNVTVYNNDKYTFFRWFDRGHIYRYNAGSINGWWRADINGHE